MILLNYYFYFLTLTYCLTKDSNHFLSNRKLFSQNKSFIGGEAASQGFSEEAQQNDTKMDPFPI